MILPTPVLPGSLDFVVAHPDHDARMIAQTFDVISCFVSDVIEKRLIARIHAAGEHKILTHQDPHFVAKIVEIVLLVNTTTPHAQHVHIRVAHGSEQLAILISANARGKTISRNPVAALGENGYAVDHKKETLA